MLFLFVPFNFDFTFAKEKQINFTTIEKNTLGSILEKNNIQINSSDELSAVISINPAINFSEKIVLGAFQGQQPTAGYEIIIYNVTETRSALFVHVQESIPSSCVVEEIITAPYHIIAVNKPKRNKEIIFVVEEVLECKNTN